MCASSHVRFGPLVASTAPAGPASIRRGSGAGRRSGATAAGGQIAVAVALVGGAATIAGWCGGAAFGLSGALAAGAGVAALGAAVLAQGRRGPPATAAGGVPGETGGEPEPGLVRDADLAATLAFHEAILDGSGVAVISTAPDGTVRTFNPAAERLLGYPRSDVVGRVTPERWHDPGEIAARAAELAAATGQPVDSGFEVFVRSARATYAEGREWTFVRRDGGRVPVWLVVSALRDRAGAIVGYCGLATDLTERKAA